MAARDEGQLLLLAGIVLVMAFVVTAFTLAQVADVEKNAAKEQEQTFLTEYRFLHGKLPAILAGNTGRTSDNASFALSFSATASSFRQNLAAKGFDATIFLAGASSGAPRTECSYTNSPASCGAATSFVSTVPLGGTEPFDGNLPYDKVDDGVLWMCDRDVGAPVGAVVHVFVSSGRHTIEETLLVALNHDWYTEERASLPVCPPPPPS